MGCAASQGLQKDDEPSQPGGAGKRKEKAPDHTVEMILMGQGESGKSTIFKQMRIIQAQEDGKREAFAEEERKGTRQLVYDNIVSQMKVLVKVAILEEMEFDKPATAELARAFETMSTEDLGREEMGAALKSLWADSSLRIIYGERDRLFNLNDGAGYFWNDLDRIYAPDYVPSEADLLRLRVRTRGYDEAVFTYKNTAFRVVDLGGQRSERREWESALAKATNVLFVASLCEWDQKLREDFTQSRMRETLHIFEALVKDPASDGKGITVLLNKLDLFREKLKSPEKAKAFATFFAFGKGTPTAESGVEHLRELFLKMARSTGRRTTVHAITAVETDNIKIAWRDIRNQVIAEVVQAVM